MNHEEIKEAAQKIQRLMDYTLATGVVTKFTQAQILRKFDASAQMAIIELLEVKTPVPPALCGESK